MSIAKARRATLCEGTPRDRRDIPVYPLMIIAQGAMCPDYNMKDMIDSLKKWMAASQYVMDKIGKPDIWQSAYAGDVMFALSLPTRRPGYELPETEIYQFIESEQIGADDYKGILETGYSKWFNNYMCSIQHEKAGAFKLILSYIKMGMHGGKIQKWLQGQDIEPIQDTGTTPVFDMLSQVRSFGEFALDLYDEPDVIKAICEQGTPEIIKTALGNVKKNVGRIALYPMRSSATAISPALFEEFSWPGIKACVEAFHAAGFQAIIHADGNWIPMLPKFMELPKASCFFEFDDQTDLVAAGDLLDGWHAFHGNVPATMLAFGTPDEVSAYCEKLITEVGLRHPGFVLSSGCEVPANAKLENLQAMVNSVR